jgi:hypothetical protein
MTNVDKRISIRVPAAVAKRLDKITNKNLDPYGPTITQVVLRGIELALREKERKLYVK